MGRHDTTRLDTARDELMSHMVRCSVLEARHEDRLEWLNDTMDYLAGRYPRLNDLELAQLEMIGRQYLKPVIPHGREHNALTRDRAMAEAIPDAEGGQVPAAAVAAA